MNSTTNTNLALRLARSQKRLQYWRGKFANTANGQGNSLLKDFSATIDSMTKSTDDAALESLEHRLITLERELTSLFESQRLMTSKIGTPATND